MNSIATFGIFIVLLIAYCAPTQGQAIDVSDVAFENGERYESTKLIRTPDGAYKIEKREGTFGIEGIDTMAGKDVVLRTTDNSYIQMELVNPKDSQQLFTMTTRSKLGESKYSYGVSKIYRYPGGLIRENLTISGFKYSTTGVPQRRFVVHSGKAVSSELEPLLLWTENDFNYQVWDTGVMLTLNAKPVDKKTGHYLVKFLSESYRRNWMSAHGLCYKSDLSTLPEDARKYFMKMLY